jgi:hypothetical protein
VNVPDNIENVNIGIDLFDDDSGRTPPTDDWCDISPRATTAGDSYSPTNAGDDGRRCNLIYSMKTGQWSGDDTLRDVNGYGHASGNEDGSTGTDQDDCEVWFDVWQNEYSTDGDRVPYWQEVNEYGTNPILWDTDNDGLSDREAYYTINDYGIIRFDPLMPEDVNGWSAPTRDWDMDGIPNAQEINNPIVGGQGTNPTNLDTDGDGISDNRDKYPLIYTNRYALVVGVTEYDFIVSWLEDLSVVESETMRDKMINIGFQVTSLIGHVTFNEFDNAIDMMKNTHNIQSTDIVVVYISTHGSDDYIGYKIAFSDDIYLGSDYLGVDGIRQRIEKFGLALDFLWLQTCDSWQFVEDGELADLEKKAGNLLFFGAHGTGYATGALEYCNAIQRGESVEETINDIQDEVFWHDFNDNDIMEPDEVGNWNSVYQLDDRYNGFLYIYGD